MFIVQSTDTRMATPNQGSPLYSLGPLVYSGFENKQRTALFLDPSHFGSEIRHRHFSAGRT